jgi:hypothetical protein
MTITDAQLQQFRDDGYFITDVLFDEATLEELRAEFRRLWDNEIRAAEEADAAHAEFVRLRPFWGISTMPARFAAASSLARCFRKSAAR